MTPFAELIQQGGAHAWLFIPSAILLGALHGLEPGHSKTMMAAFIIAVRGTVKQAILLGLAATLSHTAVVWAVALAGQYFGQKWASEANEPYFQLASAVIIIGVALWMLGRIWRERHPRPHDHHHDHGHDHGDGHHHHHDDEPQDSHALAHAEAIKKRFANQQVTTPQIILFGLTGGLIPCPAAITVLLLCLQLKEISLGVVLVLCFSIGLAVTMVAAGVLAALSVRHASGRWPWLSTMIEQAPYVSSGLILALGFYMAWHSIAVLAAAPTA